MRINRFLAVFLVMGFGITEASIVSFTSPDCGGVCQFPDASDPDNTPGMFSSVITVPASEARLINSTGDNVTVTINGLQHSWAGDVIATLTYVNTGISGDLFNRIGRTTTDPNDVGSGAMFGIGPNGVDIYSFNSSFSGDIWGNADTQGTSGVIDSGNYWTTTAGSGAKTGFSSLFNDRAAAGDWVLTLSDNFGPDGDNGGSFTSWTLSLNVSDAPEPSFTVPTALLVLGLVLFGRRYHLRAKRVS